MFTNLKKKKFLALVQSLENSMLSQGFWKYEKDTVKMFDMKDTFFLKLVPEALKQRLGDGQQCLDAWLTMCAMTTLTLFYAEKQDSEMRQRLVL